MQISLIYINSTEVKKHVYNIAADLLSRGHDFNARAVQHPHFNLIGRELNKDEINGLPINFQYEIINWLDNQISIAYSLVIDIESTKI